MSGLIATAWGREGVASVDGAATVKLQACVTVRKILCVFGSIDKAGTATTIIQLLQGVGRKSVTSPPTAATGTREISGIGLCLIPTIAEAPARILAGIGFALTVTAALLRHTIFRLTGG